MLRRLAPSLHPFLTAAILLTLPIFPAGAQFKPLKPNPADAVGEKPPSHADSRDAVITDSGAVISMDVEVVNVFASVRDRSGRYVNTLSKDDFELKEDGKPQEIKYFAAESNLPLTLGIIFDVSVSQENLIDEEKRSAKAFIRSVVGDKDLAFVISFGPDSRLEQDLTASKSLLEKAIDRLEIRGGVYSPVTPGTIPTGTPRGTVLYDAVYVAAKEMLRNPVGRKAIILLTDGVDQGSKVKIEDALREAQLSDVVIFSIFHFDPLFQAFMRGTADYDLGKMSKETGGTLFKPKRNQPLSEFFDEIQAQLRNQYSLGYTPNNPKQGNDYHKIDLAVNQKGLKVQTRKGYYSHKAAD
ncbi:MAG: VWA domain-containing protein [Bryobacterales bacterium]|nr:VWA domain-containing protein [Bryobacterales bacterium]